VLLGVWAAVAIARPAGGDETSPQELLKDKGLNKLNQYFALADESDLTRKFRELDALGKKSADAQKRAYFAGKKVEEKKQLILTYLKQRHELRVQYDKGGPIALHNKLVSAMNELGDRIEVLEKSDQEEKDAKTSRAAASQASEQYVEVLLKLRKQCDQIGEKYEQIAADPAVQKAIEDFNKENSTEMKLGPTGSFALLERNLKRLEGKVITETITLRAGAGNLWYGTVTLNGKHAQEFAIDTGASIIALPYEVAAKAGMTPSENDPTVQLTLADGHVVPGKEVFADSVRLGKFTVEHVRCAVLPANLPHADALLGLSFFEHFSYKIDSAKGKLTMAQIEQPPQPAVRRPAGRPEPRVRRAPSE
jgi:aspartyl protease family protein